MQLDLCSVRCKEEISKRQKLSQRVQEHCICSFSCLNFIILTQVLKSPPNPNRLITVFLLNKSQHGVSYIDICEIISFLQPILLMKGIHQINTPRIHELHVF